MRRAAPEAGRIAPLMTARTASRMTARTAGRIAARTAGRMTARAASLMTVRTASRMAAVCAVGALAALAAPAAAQPDPRQMSGIPLPDPQLAPGTVTVRVIRGRLTDNVPDHQVELQAGGDVRTARTDAEGRVAFADLAPGTTLVAATELDGVRITSQPFPAPAQGGIRLMLVGAADPGAPDAPVEPGDVTFGGESRLVVEVGEESVSVFYLLDVVNPGAAPVDPGAPVAFTLPPGAVSATVLRDSHPRTVVEGSAVSLEGPFPPGRTPLRVAYVLPYAGGRLPVAQPLPIDLDAAILVVERRGAMDLASGQIVRSEQVAPDGAGGATYIFAAVRPVPAGDPLTFELSGLPHHSPLPGVLTLAASFVILAVGAWGAVVPGGGAAAGADRRRRLDARRDRRLDDLVTLERQYRADRIGPTRYANRRHALMAELERVYGELDDAAGLIPLAAAPAPRAAAAVTRPSGSRAG